MIIRSENLAFILAILVCGIKSISCHARLVEPPSRSSMWRFGYDTPKNYDDDGLYCGGMNTHWKQNGGKCGVCGDPWHIPPPRPHEAGGKFGNGIIVRRYKPGQAISAIVEVTTNHRGFFEFRICPSKNPKKEVTQECLDKTLLTIVNGTNTRYHVERHGRSHIQMAVQLPRGLTCKHCVFQWTYTAGNNWGRCKNGSYGLGCGNQETFKSCADVAITDQNAMDELPVTLKPGLTTSVTYKPSKPMTAKPITVKPSRPKPTKNIYPQDNNKKKKYPSAKPDYFPVKTFQEALDRIKKDPKLRWMLEAKKPYS